MPIPEEEPEYKRWTAQQQQCFRPEGWYLVVLVVLVVLDLVVDQYKSRSHKEQDCQQS
jgi:hypothetical protein